MDSARISKDQLYRIAYNCLVDNSVEEGFYASGKEEVYGCIFGRDSALTILKVLNAHTKNPSHELLEVCRRGLLTLVALQGKEVNYENNEEPGKFIHEFRKANEEQFDVLAAVREDKPWYVEDGFIRNYDSIDSTPLALIAIYQYWQVTQDQEFITEVLTAVEAGLNWIITFGDRDKDGLVEFGIHPERKHGGPYLVQSWTDSHESLRQSNGLMPNYPIAPVELQGYAWLSLRLWADFYTQASPKFAKKLLRQAQQMKKIFNKLFIIKTKNGYFAAQALDGYKMQIKTITANPLLCLWATYFNNGQKESIIADKYIADFIKRGLQKDLFDPQAGIRTMSTHSATYNPNRDSYHNGSFWVILNGLVEEGIRNWGFTIEAKMLKQASLQPISYFQSAIEMYVVGEGGRYEGYLSSKGQTSCLSQSWSAAVMLDWASDEW